MALRYEAVKSIVRQSRGMRLLIQSKALASLTAKPYLNFHGPKAITIMSREGDLP